MVFFKSKEITNFEIFCKWFRTVEKKNVPLILATAFETIANCTITDLSNNRKIFEHGNNG